MVVSNRFIKVIKVKEHRNPREKAAEDALQFDPMMDPQKMSYDQLVQATAYFLTIVERKQSARHREMHKTTVERFLHKPLR